MADRKSFALLIDSDNVSAKYIQGIMNELTSRHGQVTYRRIYGDWTSNQMGKWKDVLAEFSLTPMQQFANTKGKNATDSFLIIDAMDILYENKVEGFCIVSSDGDFTRLASRLRDAGMTVVGMGEQKTPRSFRNACTVFTGLELLIEDEEQSTPGDKEAAKENSISKRDIASTIADIINENAGQGMQTSLSEIGNRLVGIYPDFDVRSFGYSQLSKFLESIDNLQLERHDNVILVNIHGSKHSQLDTMKFVIGEVESHGGSGIPLSQLGDSIKERFPYFNVKDYGFSKLSKWLRDIDGVTVKEDEGGVKVFPDRGVLVGRHSSELRK